MLVAFSYIFPLSLHRIHHATTSRNRQGQLVRQDAYQPGWHVDAAEDVRRLVVEDVCFAHQPFSFQTSPLTAHSLAAVGIILLFERTVAWYQWTTHPEDQHSFSAIGDLGIKFPFETTHTKHLPTTETSVRKAIVVASTGKEHTEWIRENFPDWEINIYVVDDQSANLTVFKNQGKEASVFLTYLINHYFHLPDIMYVSKSPAR